MSHLDDEALSAHLDGEDAGADGHFAECEACRTRLEAFRAVAAAVRAPVEPPGAARRDAAVAAAVRAPVVPLRRPRGRPLAAWAAAAAVVVAVAGTLSLVQSSGDDRAADTAAVSDDAGPTFEGGDLGDQSDPAELALRLRAAVEPEGGGEESVAGSPASGARTGSPTALSAESQRKAADPTVAPADPDCTRAVAAQYAEGLGSLAYRASVRWQGTPAVVLVYPVEGANGPLDHRVLVMARGDCRLLVAQTI